MAPPAETEPPEEAAPLQSCEAGGAGAAPEPEDDALMLGRASEEELRPMSLTDLFAADPECKAAPKGGGNSAADRAAAGLARSMQFAGAGIDDELELKKLQVFVRIRPSVTSGAPVPKAVAAAAAADTARENCVHATSRHSIAIAPPEGSQAYKSGDRGQTYSFTRVFDSDTPQEQYYEATAAPLVRDLLRNPSHNSAMLAYGITAAGKTYTIEGTREAPGVLPRALVALFQGLASHVEPIVARAAYYEVYNEQIYDLLDEQGVGPLGHRAVLRLKEDSLGRVFVAGLSEVEVGSADEALAVLRRGSRQRQRAETGLNYSSSRSHSIFTMTLYQQGLEGQSLDEGSAEEGGNEGSAAGEQKLGRMSFVDLAGSERAQRTGNVGVRLKESVAINSSLMTLGRCLEALRWNQQHKGSANLRVVPYRESKVTHLFRDALHGWGQVILSVNVSPVSKDYDETAHVLKYAALATQIGTIQQAEAPRRTIKAVSPAIRKVKRKAALPPEARRQGGGRAKKAKKEGAAAAAVAAHAGAAGQPVDLAAIPETAEEPEGEGSDEALGAAECGRKLDEGLGMADDAPGSGGGVAVYHLGSPGGEVEDEGEFAGTPTTPMDGADDEAVAALQAKVQQLIGDLQKAEERCVLLEAEVREEVADEMAQLLRDMEESYRVRLEAEVEALERKMGVAAEAAGKRGRGRAGKGAVKPEQQQPDHSAEELSAARAEAAEVAAEAEQLRQQAAGLAAQLEEAQGQAEQQEVAAAEHAANLEAEAEVACQHAAELAASLAAEQQRLSSLEAELAEVRQTAQAEVSCAQQQAADLQAQLTAAQDQAAQQQVQLAAAQEQAVQQQVLLTAAIDQAAGNKTQLELAQKQAAEQQAQLAATQGHVAQVEADLAAAQQRAAQLEADLAAVHDAVHSDQQQASEEYEAQLQEAVTQLEANKSMELEMAEQQCERLRKENMALSARLQAAMAALAACGSPSAMGPGSLAARMAQAAPEGQGRGAGGTPHDVALARARQAAAADDLAAAAAAAAAAGGSSAGAVGTVARSRSRFAGEAEAPPAGWPSAGLKPAQEAPEHEAVAAAESVAAAEEQTQPAPRRRGRPKKAVAFAGMPEEEDEQQQPTAAQTVLQQQPPAAGEQPRPSQRRAKKSVAFAAVPEEREEEQQPAGAQPEQQQQQQAAASDPSAGAAPVAAESRRARRMTRAVAAAAPLAEAEPEQAQAAEPAPEQAGKQRHGRRRTQVQASIEEEPGASSAALQPAQPHAQQSAGEQQVAPARKVRASAAAAADKENAAGLGAEVRIGKLAAIPEGEPAASEARQQDQEQQPAASKGGKRRKRLLPAAPLSSDMRVALGELEDGVHLRQQVAAKRAAAKSAAGLAKGAAAAAEENDAPSEAGGRRSRRQTQFYRL